MVYEIMNDIDPIETKEWLEALKAVLANDGDERAAFLIKSLIDKANEQGVNLSTTLKGG